jgi:predicted Zn-dependent protease
VARTPAQLAAVVGHEIGHVQADHANARLSTQFAADAGLSIVQVLGTGHDAREPDGGDYWVRARR